MYNIAYIIGAITRLGQYIALLKAILNVLSGQAIGILQVPLAGLLVYVSRQFAKTEVLTSTEMNAFYFKYAAIWVFVMPFITLGLLFWVFH